MEKWVTFKGYSLLLDEESFIIRATKQDENGGYLTAHVYIRDKKTGIGVTTKVKYNTFKRGYTTGKYFIK